LWELDLDELTPKQRAEWDRVEAERERSRKLHERFAKKMAHRAAVRDGLLPPPWLCETQGLPAPEAQETPVRRITAKNWITVEAQRLKRLDKIPAGISKTDFAKMLAGNLKAAAVGDPSISVHSGSWKYIRNNLSDWGVWPIRVIE